MGGRGFFTPPEHFLWNPKKSRSDVLKFPNFMKKPPNQQNKGDMVWPRSFDEFWVEIFGEGDSRQLREINPKHAGKKKRLKRGCPLSYQKMSS